ncbi:MAG: response regulator, partial [Syntrophobacteraceae bacterium]|nr:response regulator [Syntrophobacteraceae bacterium]
PRFVETFGYTLEDMPDEGAWLRGVFAGGNSGVADSTDRGLQPSEIPTVGFAEDRMVAIRCRDGTDKVARVRSVAVGDGKNLLCFEDVTEQLKVEEERGRLATVIEQASELVIITDLHARIRYVNRAFEMTTGYTRAELLDRGLTVFENGRYGNDAQGAILRALEKGEVWRGHLVGKTKDEDNYDVEATFSPVRSSSGEVVSFASVQRNVTNEMHLEKQLRQSQKMEAIGTLAGGIAHDFNNILGAIMGYTEMSLDMVPKGSLAQLNLDQVLKAANRAKDLVRQILLFSRRGEQERQQLLVMSTIKEALKLLRASLPATVEIRRIVTAHPDIQILGDPTQIHQVMLNLCTNAAHAMREKGGTLDVEVAEEELAAADLASEPGLRPGSYVRLTVRDTGHGIERQLLDRIFEPFFTTKGPFEGTGMGLAVVHGIVKRHDGFIRVSSEVGKGTGFDLYFPKFANAEALRASDAPEIPRGHGRILFVDDEAALTRLAREMLESLGYEVTVENGAIEALETFEGRANAFDLVITDYTMPRMTGLELAGAILAIRPEIPVILCSGYSDMISEEKIREAGIREFIMKPVGLREMADAVRRVLH